VSAQAGCVRLAGHELPDVCRMRHGAVPAQRGRDSLVNGGGLLRLRASLRAQLYQAELNIYLRSQGVCRACCRQERKAPPKMLLSSHIHVMVEIRLMYSAV